MDGLAKQPSHVLTRKSDPDPACKNDCKRVDYAQRQAGWASKAYVGW